MSFRISISLLVLALSACEPIFMLPGGQLSGAVATVPHDWSQTDAIKTIQLETNPGDPYSVNIWSIGMDETLYVHAGANRATWVENILANPQVRVRIADKLYELSATRVNSQDEFDRFSDAYEKKYERRPRNENVGEAYLFALHGRG